MMLGAGSDAQLYNPVRDSFCMNDNDSSLVLLVSVIHRKGSEERHLALYGQKCLGKPFIGTDSGYVAQASTTAPEPWIWIDWPQVFRFSGIWIHRHYRSITRKRSSTSQ